MSERIYLTDREKQILAYLSEKEGDQFTLTEICQHVKVKGRAARISVAATLRNLGNKLVYGKAGQLQIISPRGRGNEGVYAFQLNKAELDAKTT